MAFGILEDRHLDSVPGTALLSDLKVSHGHQVAVTEASNLKRGIGRNSHVILIPQPSDDPRDPLNWPVWKREACYWTLAFLASLDGVLSPMVAAAYQQLAGEFGVSVDEISSSFGAIILGLGCFMLFQGALAVKFGHRLIYLCSVSLMFVTSIWCAVNPNLASIRAARIFQGFGMSALQSLVASTIEQIFFVHERGARSVMWSFAIMFGITLGPFIAGYIVQYLSWQWAFWLMTIPLGIGVFLVFFFVPETTYDRPGMTEVVTESGREDSASSNEKPIFEKDRSVDRGSPTSEIYPKAPGYISELKIWHGTFSDANLIKIFLRPLPLIFSPVAWFVFLVYSLPTVWLSLLSQCSSTLFTIEYDFNTSQIGLTNLGGLIGSIVAMVFSGYMTDWWAIWMSKRNSGVYEPEFRLFMVTTMLLGVFGYAGWGVGSARGMPWIGAVACFTLINFSMVAAGAAAVTYLLDTHGSDALHILAITNFLKNMIIYGLLFIINSMVERLGVTVCLYIFAGLQAFCWLGSIPMYIYGKRVRSFIARRPEFFILGRD